MSLHLQHKYDYSEAFCNIQNHCGQATEILASLANNLENDIINCNFIKCMLIKNAKTIFPTWLTDSLKRMNTKERICLTNLNPCKIGLTI